MNFKFFRQILGKFKKNDGKNENLVRFFKKIRKFKANVGITFSQRLTRKWKKNEKCKKLNIEKYSKNVIFWENDFSKYLEKVRSRAKIFGEINS